MTVLAHGGTPGLVAELSIGALVVAAVAFVWLRERRRRARGGPTRAARMRDEE